MDCLLFGGAESVGKSETIYRLTIGLLSKGFIDISRAVPTSFADFSAVLEGLDKHGKNIRIIINTATDTPGLIYRFKRFYDSNGNYDILISSIRDDNFWPRNQFFTIMGISSASHKIIEIPLAKITRRGINFSSALSWYETSNDALNQHVLSLTPFNI
jgi:GTPase SAR1 family protein